MSKRAKCGRSTRSAALLGVCRTIKAALVLPDDVALLLVCKIPKK
jgi:hypothetical protein